MRWSGVWRGLGEGGRVGMVVGRDGSLIEFQINMNE